MKLGLGLTRGQKNEGCQNSHKQNSFRILNCDQNYERINGANSKLENSAYDEFCHC